MFASSGCQDKNIPFNTTGWNEDVDGEPCPPLRKLMVDDLLSNHQIKGLTYQQIVLKLGVPDNHEQTPPGLLRYEIIVDYTYGDIVHIKALDFYFAKDSIINTWKFVKFDIDM